LNHETHAQLLWHVSNKSRLGAEQSASTEREGRDKLVESLRDKRFRHAFASASSRRAIAEQIRETRVSRGWTQSELAQSCGKLQEVISQLENPNYGRYTYRTLERLAEALDVALIVRFAPFSELVRWMRELSPEDLAVPDFEHDRGLLPSRHGELNATAAVVMETSTDSSNERFKILRFPGNPSYQREEQFSQNSTPIVRPESLVSTTSSGRRSV
jgi:transcriptional regulator with XRE-family HTH domain